MTVLFLEQNTPYDPDVMEAKSLRALVFFVNLKAIKSELAGENEACIVNSYCSFQIYMRGGIIRDEVSVGLCCGDVPCGPL